MTQLIITMETLHLVNMLIYWLLSAHGQLLFWCWWVPSWWMMVGALMADVCPHGSCVLSWQMMSALMAAHSVCPHGSWWWVPSWRLMVLSWQMMVPSWHMMRVVMVTVIANRPLLPVGLWCCPTGALVPWRAWRGLMSPLRGSVSLKGLKGFNVALQGLWLPEGLWCLLSGALFSEGPEGVWL